LKESLKKFNWLDDKAGIMTPRWELKDNLGACLPEADDMHSGGVDSF